MKQRLIQLYFTEGADLTDNDVLVGAAAACGLDAATTREWLSGERDVADVTRQAESAKEAGIDGVPCFIFGDTVAVSGAQAPDYLVDTMQRAVTERARQAAQPAG
jgi:predicted DsbA family dithiol-disulfide isomerase